MSESDPPRTPPEAEPPVSADEILNPPLPPPIDDSWRPEPTE